MKNCRVFEIKCKMDINGNMTFVIKDFRNNKTKRFYQDYNKDWQDQAVKYLETKGINILYKAESKEGYFLVTDNFNIMI